MVSYYAKQVHAYLLYGGIEVGDLAGDCSANWIVGLLAVVTPAEGFLSRLNDWSVGSIIKKNESFEA